MFSIDANIQTSLERQAELMRTVQTNDAKPTQEPTVRTAPSIWSALLVALLAAIRLGGPA